MTKHTIKVGRHKTIEDIWVLDPTIYNSFVEDEVALLKEYDWFDISFTLPHTFGSKKRNATAHPVK